MQSQYPVVEAVLIGTRAMCLSFSAGYYSCQTFCARPEMILQGGKKMFKPFSIGKDGKVFQCFLAALSTEWDPFL
jgi:hypothetical protein